MAEGMQPLGAILVSKGYLDQQKLDAALAVTKDTKIPVPKPIIYEINMVKS